MPVLRSAAAALSALALAAPAAAAPSRVQTTFRDALLADARTTPAVKRALRSGAAFVAPRPLFGDLTGDGKADAVAPVTTGGAAGTVALYVFSTDGAAGGALRVVFRSQSLYRATVALRERTLRLRTPRHAPGDRLCCPARVLERTYEWSAGAQTLRVTASREIAGPRAARRS